MSILEKLSAAINEEGMLPDHFVLSDEHSEENLLKFAPGAIDGMAFYHGLAAQKDSNDLDFLIKAVHAASDGDTESAFDYAYKFAEKGIMLHNIDDILDYVVDNAENLNAENIFSFASELVFDSDENEALKFGLALLELFDNNLSEKFKEIIRLLASYDEFTLSAAFHMRKWDNASQEMFAAVKRVKDWGRIHLVRMWEPENEEMEQWLIMNGVKNGVAEYSGLDCFRKVHFMERITKEMPLDIYRGLSAILSDLLMEEPVYGISAIENRQEVIGEFVAATKRRTDLEAEDYKTLMELLKYCKDDDNNCTEFYDDIKMIVCDESFAAKIQTALEKHECFDMARELGYNYHPYAYEAVCENVLKNVWSAVMLVEDGYRTEEIYEMVNKAIDLEELAVGSSGILSDKMFSEKDFTVIMMLQSLEERVGENIPLVKAALLSANHKIRHRALNIIESWMKQTSDPVDKISPELAEYIKKITDDEAIDEFKQRMKNIINNDIQEEN